MLEIKFCSILQCWLRRAFVLFLQHLTSASSDIVSGGITEVQPILIPKIIVPPLCRNTPLSAFGFLQKRNLTVGLGSLGLLTFLFYVWWLIPFELNDWVHTLQVVLDL